MSSNHFTRFGWGVLAYNLAVIVWGAYVRATGSGAGCGNHWPLCNGEVIPRSPSVETLIEYSHRVTSGLALLLVVALLALSRHVFSAGHPARRAASLAMLFMLSEAAVGAGLVLFELVAENESIARALFMAIHLTNTFLLLAALTLTPYFAGGAPPPRRAGRKRLRRLMAAAAAGTVLMGMSGAVAALGDTLFPAKSLLEALRADLSPTSHVLIQLRILHPLIAVLTCLLLLYLIAQVRKLPPQHPAKAWASRLNLLIFAQVGAGTANILLLAPVWMQLVHLLLADLVWILLVLTCAAALADDDAVAA